MFQWAKEAAEAERLEKMRALEKEDDNASSMNDLALAIQNRNKTRMAEADSFFDSLIDKYAKKAEKPNKNTKTPVAKRKKLNK